MTDTPTLLSARVRGRAHDITWGRVAPPTAGEMAALADKIGELEYRFGLTKESRFQVWEDVFGFEWADALRAFVQGEDMPLWSLLEDVFEQARQEAPIHE